MFHLWNFSFIKVKLYLAVIHTYIVMLSNNDVSKLLFNTDFCRSSFDGFEGLTFLVFKGFREMLAALIVSLYLFAV